METTATPAQSAAPSAAATTASNALAGPRRRSAPAPRPPRTTPPPGPGGPAPGGPSRNPEDQHGKPGPEAGRWAAGPGRRTVLQSRRRTRRPRSTPARPATAPTGLRPRRDREPRSRASRRQWADLRQLARPGAGAPATGHDERPNAQRTSPVPTNLPPAGRRPAMDAIPPATTVTLAARRRRLMERRSEAPDASAWEGFRRVEGPVAQPGPTHHVLPRSVRRRESAELARWSPITNSSSGPITQLDWSPVGGVPWSSKMYGRRARCR